MGVLRGRGKPPLQTDWRTCCSSRGSCAQELVRQVAARHEVHLRQAAQSCCCVVLNRLMWSHRALLDAHNDKKHFRPLGAITTT